MKTFGELFEDAMNHWRDNKGVGTALILPPLNDKVIVLGILQRVCNKSPTAKIIICVNSFDERIAIIEFLTNQEGEDENNAEFKKLIKDGNIKILTNDFISKSMYIGKPLLSIIYHPLTIDSGAKALLEVSKFKLVVMNKLLVNNEDSALLYKLCPLLDDFKQNEINAIRVSSPVEDIRLGVAIPEDSKDGELLKHYNEYVSTSMSIFGSFDVMNQARIGNTQLNISAAQICAQIAQENGWNEHLDMSTEFNVQIDELYNPGRLKDRASDTYEVIRKRSNLLSDYDGKLEVIYNIVHDNHNKKILIINKRGDFASKVTDYLNNLSETIICGNYHDKVSPIPAVDVHGNPLYYKSGNRKGERRMMADKAQRNFNEAAFNRGDIRVLSTSNSPDKTLCIDVDIVIITSPQCEELKSYIYRLDGLKFRDNTIHLYNIYCKNTMEEKLLDNQTILSNHKVLNDEEKVVIEQDNSDFIVVD
jgi:hypothetical protein